MTDPNIMDSQRPLSGAEVEHIRAINDGGHQFWLLCNGMGQSRELSLAKTKIEEAVMWAVKHITK